jgi:hypothetical protein
MQLAQRTLICQVGALLPAPPVVTRQAIAPLAVSKQAKT